MDRSHLYAGGVFEDLLHETSGAVDVVVFGGSAQQLGEAAAQILESVVVDVETHNLFCQPPADLHRSFAGEGHRSDALQGRPVDQKTQQAIDQHLGLARSGRGPQNDMTLGVGSHLLDVTGESRS